MSRIAPLVDDLLGTEDADDIMIEIMDVLSDSIASTPEVGKIYVFVYQPKTPKIRYDQNPLIACVSIDRWGFKGLNYHWGKFRNYTWNEVVGNLHVIYPLELKDARSIPFQHFLYS